MQEDPDPNRAYADPTTHADPCGPGFTILVSPDVVLTHLVGGHDLNADWTADGVAAQN